MSNPVLAHEGPIVVGFDSSESARHALDWALREGKMRDRSVRIVHAYRGINALPALGYGLAADPLLAEEMREQAKHVLSEGLAHARACAPEVMVEGSVIEGEPAHVLLEESKHAAHIVLGTRGLGGFRGMLLGSVGVQVSSHAHCPVVVVRRSLRDLPADAPVIVGVDGSPQSNTAIGVAFEAASFLSAPLVAIHAWSLPSITAPGATAVPEPDDLREVRDAEIRLSAEAMAGFTDTYPDVRVSQQVIGGEPERVLVDASHGARLVVVGSRGRGGFSGLLLGSVSHALLHHSEAPVAVVRA